MVEAALGRRAPFGRNLLENAKRIPELAVKMKITGEKIQAAGVAVSIDVTLTLHNKHILEENANPHRQNHRGLYGADAPSPYAHHTVSIVVTTNDGVSSRSA